MATVAGVVAVLVGAGAAGAVTDSTVLQAKKGDQVVVNKKLRCYVAWHSITCGGAPSAGIGARILNNGSIIILASLPLYEPQWARFGYDPT